MEQKMVTVEIALPKGGQMEVTMPLMGNGTKVGYPQRAVIKGATFNWMELLDFEGMETIRKLAETAFYGKGKA